MASNISLVLLVILFVSCQHLASAFWFADSSLYTTREPTISDPNPNNNKEVALLLESLANVSTNSEATIDKVSQLELSSDAKVSQNISSTEIDEKLKNKQQVDSNKQQQQLSQCSCDSLWFAREYSKWLLANSNSSIAVKGQQLQANLQQQHNGNNNNNNNQQQHQPHPRQSHWHKRTTGKLAKFDVTQKTVKCEKGDKGDKGDRGEKGEKGERGSDCIPQTNNQLTGKSSSSLISIFGDRDEMFDSKLESGSLAFVNSEQILTLKTNNGWKVLKMDNNELIDFRKLKPQFKLSSEGEKLKLISMRKKNNKLSNDIILKNKLSRNSNSFNLKEIYDEDLDELDGEDDDDDDEDDGEKDGDEKVDISNFEKKVNKNLSTIEKKSSSNNKNDKSTVPDNNGNTDISNNIRENKKNILSTDNDDDDDDDDDDDEENEVNVKTLDNDIKAKKKVSDLNKKIDNKQSRQWLSDSTFDSKRKIQLVALNAPFAGNLHGGRGADFECRRHASRANLKGSFKAFLSSSLENLNELVRRETDKRLPVINLHGDILANSWNELFRQPTRHLNPLSKIYSFDGRNIGSDSGKIWPNKLVWHGATNKAGIRDLVNNCHNWHSDSLTRFGFASPLFVQQQHGTSKHLSLHHNNNKHHNHNQQQQHSNDSIAQNKPQFHSILETIHKYPCRMPLIVLCVETSGYPTILSENSNENNSDSKANKQNKRKKSDNNQENEDDTTDANYLSTNIIA